MAVNFSRIFLDRTKAGRRGARHADRARSGGKGPEKLARYGITHAWSDPSSIACVVPDGAMPHAINGTAVQSWRDALTSDAGWEALVQEGLVSEPVFNAPVGYKKAASVVLCEPDGRVWVVAPSR